MKKLVLMTWEQVIKLLDFLFEVMKWVLPVVMNLSNNGKEEKKMTWQVKVKQLMAAKGMNQKQLSQLSGITEASVSRYLKGERTARLDIIVNFAKALNVTTEYLLNDDEETEIRPYTEIATAIARNGGSLTAEEKNSLIAMILGSGD